MDRLFDVDNIGAKIVGHHDEISLLHKDKIIAQGRDRQYECRVTKKLILLLSVVVRFLYTMKMF